MTNVKQQIDEFWAGFNVDNKNHVNGDEKAIIGWDSMRLEIVKDYQKLFDNGTEFWNGYGHFDGKLFHYIDPANIVRIIKSVTPQEYMTEHFK